MTLTEAIRRYINQQQLNGLSHYTIRGARSALKELREVLESLNIDQIEHIDHDTLMQYREVIAFRLTPKGKPLGARTQGTLIGHVRAFCQWLQTSGLLLHDPAERLVAPKKPKTLPKAILELDEVQTLINLPDTSNRTGFRNRLILEILYCTGIRVSEVVHLTLTDVNLEDGYLFIRQGKGMKDRVVPLARTVCDRLQSYLIDLRPGWIKSDAVPHLFLNRWGEGMDSNAVYHIVKKYVKLAGFEKNISTHSFRHTCATHMIRNGAPIRHVQEMLGHESLETTQIYTRITINDLREAHRKYHPSEQNLDDDDAKDD